MDDTPALARAQGPARMQDGIFTASTGLENLHLQTRLPYPQLFGTQKLRVMLALRSAHRLTACLKIPLCAPLIKGQKWYSIGGDKSRPKGLCPQTGFGHNMNSQPCEGGAAAEPTIPSATVSGMSSTGYFLSRI